MAYFFTGDSVDGSVFHRIVDEICKKAADVGLRVAAVTSDMGSSNRAMWRTYGIKSTRFDDPVNSVVHPVDENSRLFFIADPPHLIKNLKSLLVRNMAIVLPGDVVRRHNLTHDTVDMRPIRHLVKFQANKHMLLAPKLSASSIDPNHFDKMNVGQALNFFSKSVSAGIRYMVSHAQEPGSELSGIVTSGVAGQYLATAWFFEQVDHWFDLMSSRHPVMALSKSKPDKYAEAVAFLRSFAYLIKSISAGQGQWKPVQSGIILSTHSVLELAECLLPKQSFLLTSRLTQDCLENLFSSVRYKNPNPTCREFRFALKTIMVAQFLAISTSGNYEQDDREYMAEFLDCSTVPPAIDTPDDVVLCMLEEGFEMSKDEANSLYYLAGYTLQSCRKQKQTCEQCFNAALRNDDAANELPSQLSALKEFTAAESLCYVSKAVYDQFVLWERIIRDIETQVLVRPNISQQIFDNCMLHTELSLPTCHSLVAKLCRKFIHARLHFLARKLSKGRNQHHTGALGSRSAAMRVLAQKIK